MWYANNLIIPIVIIYSPYLLTLLSAHFHKVNFTKSFYELSITGALSLLGINVIRTSSSLLSEKLNENKIPPEFLKNVTGDIESVRTKLRLWAIMLTFIGGIFYFVQAGTLLDAKETVVKWYVLSFFILCFFSIFIGRIITAIQSNFTDNDNLIAIWMKLLNYKGEEEYANLKNLAEKGGL
ncbi:hypothetical protein GCM10011386_39140 [Parapedobacter defluvii]|uniref:Uncharacterized protein n=1 Tax=Parapedobacter defluvii TaxID=2045106 RepID=A0ABQ1MNR1_9SPHI|nr:hypothetical protein [Parapedobacter defluvii]GGC43010.1 hypothetical protein GCM10011386_39140 [Parapedobacter defluvii]